VAETEMAVGKVDGGRSREGKKPDTRAPYWLKDRTRPQFEIVRSTKFMCRYPFLLDGARLCGGAGTNGKGRRGVEPWK
jgi:hypothetical protein